MEHADEFTGLVDQNHNYNSFYPGTQELQNNNPYEPYPANDIEQRDNKLTSEQDGDFLSLSKSNNVRLNFIRKVYTILSLQLIMTWSGVFLAAYHEPTRVFLKETISLLVIACLTSLITCYALVCYPALATRVPINFILLFIFTLAESYVVSNLTAYYSKDDVLIATSLTATVVVAISVYACCTRTDFTMMGGVLFAALCVLCVASFFGWIFGGGKIWTILISSVGCVIFSVYLVYDTQMVVGGASGIWGEGKERQMVLDIDMYVFAAMSIYLDIINIFIYILKIVGESRN